MDLATIFWILVVVASVATLLSLAACMRSSQISRKIEREKNRIDEDG